MSVALVQPAPSEGGETHLVVEIGRKPFALPLHEVAEVHAMVEITPVPSFFPPLLGVISVRSRRLAVVDLSSRLGAERCRADSSTYVIEVGTTEARFGLLVDAVRGLFGSAEVESLAFVPAAFAPRKPFCMGFVLDGDETSVAVLDVHHLLTVTEWTAAVASSEVPSRLGR